jgi:hypothetical protein
VSRSTLERYGFPILAGVLPLALYGLTACRSIFWMDTTEFMLVGRYLAVSHPPGYPLLSLIVRLFSMVPVLALPLRLNMVAALAAAGSCVFAYLIVLELTRDRLAGLFSALLWAVSFELWQQATVLEVYSFQVLLLGALLLAAIKWQSAAEPRWLLAAFFIFGLALCNHTPIVLWVPSLLVLLLTSPARPGPRLLAFGVLLTGLTLCLYLYIPLRSPAPSGQFWTGVNNLSDLVQFVSGKIYRYRLLAGGSEYLGRQALELPALAGKQLLVAWALVIPGAALLWRSRRNLLLALLLGTVVVIVAALAYNIPDKEGYLLPAYLVLLTIAGCGFALLRTTRAKRTIAPLGLILIALPVVLYYPHQDRSRLHALSGLSQAVITGLPENAVLFTDDYGLFQGVRWQQLVDGRRTDVLAVSQFYLAAPWYLDQLGRSARVPEAAISAVLHLWKNPERLSDLQFGEAAKATSRQVMFLLMRERLATSRVFWVPRDFSDWPRDLNGLRLTMRGLCYEVAARDTLPDLVSPLPPANQYRITMYRDPETQDVCRRFAATACRRGIIRFAANANVEAIRNFDLALEYFPDYPSAIEDKGIVFYYSNQPDSARYYLKRFVSLDPKSPEIPKVRQVLAQLGS